MSEALSISNMRYRWPNSTKDTLNIPQLRIDTGQRVFIYGPSGSGKSTLLNLIAGVIQPQQGEIEVLGQPLTTLSARARDRFRAQHIGFIFQQFNLISYLTVADNLALAQHFSAPNWFTRANTQSQSEENTTLTKLTLLKQLGLPEELLTRKAIELSVGQQQRVAVARALINRPQLIIADEPSSALDSDARDDFLALLLSCAEQFNSTVIFVSHDKSMMPHFETHIDLMSLNQAQEGYKHVG